MKRQGRYRGARKRIGLLIPVLVVLCILAAVALYIIDNNTTFTRDGSFVITQKEEPPKDVETTLIIDEPDGTSVAEEIKQEPPTPSDEALTTKSLFIPIGTVKSAELFDAELASAKSLDVNTLVFEVKAEDGSLAFATNTKMGTKMGLAGDSAALASAADKARSAGYRVAFYMSCFKDNEAARKNAPNAVRTGNKVLWIDGENTRWISPYSDGATEYLTELIGEIAAFSPDEIILSNVSFPAIGKPELIAYEDGGVSKADKLSQFIASARAAAGEIKLSAVYENYKDKALAESGQKKEAFASSFDAVYINEQGGKRNASFADVSASFENAVIISKNPTGSEYLIKE
ncbi:MAG: hypothetical protein IKM21_00565 [Oscillospiraceae bacterium]|nr:hypothetical protein [Oscillospiraceae bacterium]